METNDPSIILAEKPTGNLDSITGQEIMAIFQKLNMEGKTILLVAQEHDIAMHTQRIIYLRDGSIPREEKVEKLFVFACNQNCVNLVKANENFKEERINFA